MLIPNRFNGYRRDGRRIYYLDVGGSAPDTSGQNAAALQQAALSREQLDWTKQVYADTAPQRADSIKRANEISDAQLAALKKQTAITDDYDNYNKTTFRPLEQGIVADAQGYDTTARRDSAAASATADVQSNIDQQRTGTQQAMARRGVNPASGASVATQGLMDVAAAKAKAGAASTARTQVETIGAARKMDAANLGRGLASAQATSAGIALNQGNSASANGQVAGNVTAQGNQIVNSGYSGAQNGLAGAASTYGSIANTQMRANDTSGQMQGLAQLGMAGKYMISDKNAKEGRKSVKPEISLAAIRKLPVESWKYKPELGDGKRHVGPMAQDVHKGLGEATAPGGKVVDTISLHGHTINAVKALDKRLIRLENTRSKGKARGN